MAKLVEIQDRLEGSFRLVLSNREFLKEGKLKSVSASTGKKFERYIFLVILHPIRVFPSLALDSIEHLQNHEKTKKNSVAKCYPH